jgi:hypothetical protein
MAVDREYRIRISTVGDPSGAQAMTGALNGATEATKEGGKQAEHAGLSHRALHMILHQVGEGSKAAEIGLAALAGVMMGSATFGVMAVVQGVRLLIDHFQKLKEKSLEVAKATVEVWKDTVAANMDARQAAEEYAQALEKIFKNVDTLKQKESEEETVLKKRMEARLKILDAERQAEISKAGGDKGEEARINERYGRKKAGVELQNEAAEIELKKKHLAEQTAAGAGLAAAADAAEKAKEAGAPGRQEAQAAKRRLTGRDKELADLEEKAESTARAAAGPHNQLYGPQQAELDRVAAQKAAEALSAAQQDYERSEAEVNRYENETKKLADQAKEANTALAEHVKALDAAKGDIGKAEAAHRGSVDEAGTIQGVKDKAEIEGAGGRYNRTSANVLGAVRAMAGAGEGTPMSGQDTAYFNNLLAASRDTGKERMFKAVIEELKNTHIDEAKKWQDLMEVIRKIRREAASTTNTLPGN